MLTDSTDVWLPLLLSGEGLPSTAVTVGLTVAALMFVSIGMYGGLLTCMVILPLWVH
jgi:hypothetical protein